MPFLLLVVVHRVYARADVGINTPHREGECDGVGAGIGEGGREDGGDAGLESEVGLNGSRKRSGCECDRKKNCSDEQYSDGCQHILNNNSYIN